MVLPSVLFLHLEICEHETVARMLMKFIEALAW